MMAVSIESLDSPSIPDKKSVDEERRYGDFEDLLRDDKDIQMVDR